MKKFTLSVAVAISFSISVNAGTPFTGATEFTQILNNGELAAQTAKQLQQYATQLQQYYVQYQEWYRKIQGLKMMVANIGQLPENMKQDFLNMALKMKKQMEQGQAITFTAANLNQQFNKIFKGYEHFLHKNNASAQSFDEAYKSMYQSTRDTALNSLKTLGIQEKDLQNDQAFMSKLRVAMNTAQGTEAAIAVANQLSYHQTEAIQKLQKTVMTQANLQAQFIAEQNQEKQMAAAAQEAFAPKPKVNRSDDESPIRYLK